MGLTFNVGPGVLIPRPETEILCEYVIEKIKNITEPVVVDLCSGSGCIGLSVAYYNKNAKVFLVEKSNEALLYLRKNLEKLNLKNVTVIHGDVFKVKGLTDALPVADIIVSNPPYIRSNEISHLQTEVQKEPVMALDGGKDGLDFYRCLCCEWTRHLKKSGIMALECGEDQANDIAELFFKNSLEHKIIKDYNNIDRIVLGGKNHNDF